MHDLEADLESRKVPASPLDILADELGAATGRIERELRLKDEARAARFEARLAAIELAAFKAEEERQRKFEARMAELRDGKDGEPGKDADVSVLISKVDDAIECLDYKYNDTEAKIVGLVESKLSEVKDGRDGEPGKDADIEPLREVVIAQINDVEDQLKDFVQVSESAAIQRIDARLAKVKDGKDGEPGKNGEPGPIGLPGKDGKDGKMPIARHWTNRVHYAGDVVRHNGATYQALEDTGSEPPSGDWGELAGRGVDGRGFVVRGTYDASAEYRQNDIVASGSGSFVAVHDGPGTLPGDGWQLLAGRGKPGKEGPAGPRGEKGLPGSAFVIAETDPEAMEVRLKDASGNAVAVDLSPIAERILDEAR